MSQSSNNDSQNNEVFRIGNQIYTSITYFKSNWKLFNVFIPAFILRVSAGLIISWTLYIQHPISEKIKEFSTIFYVGSILGALMVALTIFKIQKKKFNYISGVFVALHGILLLIAYDDLYGLLIGNFLSGVAYGLVTLSSGIHASEISVSSKRGRHIASLQAGITLGVLIGLQIFVKTVKNSLESAWFWRINGIILILCGTLAIGSTYYFFMESPAFWIYKEDNIKARNIMLKYRNEIYETFEIVNDLQIINSYVHHGIEDINTYIPGVSFAKEKYLKFLKIAIIRVTYAFGTALTLNIILISYEAWIVDSSERIVTYILPRFFTEIVMIMFIDRLGRRWPLIVSTVVCGLILLVINIIMLNVQQESTANFFSNSTFFALGILTIFYQSFIGVGLSISPQILTVEIFDFHSKPFFNYLLFMLEHICCIIIILYLKTQNYNINAYFFITVIFQILTGFITWYFIKETKKLDILCSCTLFK